MASTNKTTNYELSQYVGSDKPTYLGDYNSDMLKIDAGMKANADLFDKFNLNPTQYNFNSASISYTGCSGVSGSITVAKDSTDSIFKCYGRLIVSVPEEGSFNFTISNAISNDTQYIINCAGLLQDESTFNLRSMLNMYVNADNSITVNGYAEAGNYSFYLLPCIYFNKTFGDEE